MKAIFFVLFGVLLVVFIAFFGCVQNPPGGQPPAQTGAILQTETSDLTTDLNDFSDLQNSLNDSSLEDSGIDANSFG